MTHRTLTGPVLPAQVDLHGLANKLAIQRTAEDVQALPLESDGSIGGAFSCWHAALRTYEIVEKIADKTGETTRPKLWRPIERLWLNCGVIG